MAAGSWRSPLRVMQFRDRYPSCQNTATLLRRLAPAVLPARGPSHTDATSLDSPGETRVERACGVTPMGERSHISSQSSEDDPVG